MTFNSYIFILLFLPIMLAAYYTVGRIKNGKYSNYVLIAASMVFFAYASILAVLVLIISSLVNYCFSKQVIQSDKKNRKTLLIAGIVFDVTALVFFKYGSVAFNTIGGVIGNIILPLGISFYTFQEIAFLIDCYRKEVPYCGLKDYLLFISFFPKAIQGPIVYHSELLPQLADNENKKFDYCNFSKGIFLFAIGLSKKVLVADNFAKIVDYGYTHITSLNGFEALLTIIAYSIQLYCDFSGYTDMAIGCAYMLNIELPWNFDSPYKAKNISEFWGRWHITLTRFLTKYVYIPLGGSRKGLVRTIINILIVFIISGLWHGTGVTFLIWGLMHGLVTVLYRLIKKAYDKIPQIVQWLMTFSFVSITWVFFRASTISNAVALLKRVFVGSWQLTINAELEESLLQPTLINAPSQILPFVIVIIGFFVVTMLCIVFMKNSRQILEKFTPNVKTWIITYILFVLSILSLSGVTGFLYTNF